MGVTSSAWLSATQGDAATRGAAQRQGGCVRVDGAGVPLRDGQGRFPPSILWLNICRQFVGRGSAIPKFKSVAINEF